MLQKMTQHGKHNQSIASESNVWYHCIGTTYGTWLPGDDRGWRTRDHREHVDGDYRSPPVPSARQDQLNYSAKDLIGGRRVVLDGCLRHIVLGFLGEALEHHHVNVSELALMVTHYHLLARFPATGVAGLSVAHHQGKGGRNPVARYVLGKAHSWVAKCVRDLQNLDTTTTSTQSPASPDAGIPAPRETPKPKPRQSSIFAVKPKVIPNNSERQYHETLRYIREHELKHTDCLLWSRRPAI